MIMMNIALFHRNKKVSKLQVTPPQGEKSGFASVISFISIF